MSSGLAEEAMENNVSTIDDEAYEPPTYDEAFPPMASGDGDVEPTHGGVSPPVNQWHNKMSVRSSNVTQVFTVPVEERKFKEMSQQNFGEKGGEQAKICAEIMQKFGVHIEMSLARDKSLSVVITGKVDKVMMARKEVVQQLQTQANASMHIPREHHKYIIGQKGKNLTQLELKTATKISIPRPNENTDVIKITGTKEGIEAARHEIQLISDEQAKLAFERLNIERIYHPFIQGPNNLTVQELMQRTGAKIHIPPVSAMKDEVVVSGEKDGVMTAVHEINKIYQEKKRSCTTVSVEIRKSQHKYVIGPRGQALAEILEETGVSVEVPPANSPFETITLRGEPDKVGPALTMVYSKANSVIVADIEAPAWLHRFIIGAKGANIRKIMDDYPKVHIEFTDGKDKIVVEGPPEEVNQARQALEEQTRDLLSKMAFAEIEVDQKYHRHIIGKKGSNVGRIKEENNVSIKIPSDKEASNVIRIEGNPEGVAIAKKELLEMVHKMENEKTRDILIEQRFHKNLIGAAGGKIKEIRDRFNQVQVTFPEASKKTDVVTLRGPKNDVDRCYKYLQTIHAEMLTNNYQAHVHIFKQFHKNIIGKGGANIRAIRDETDTKIDLPSESSDSDVITITGKRQNVEQAKGKIEAIQKELANIKEITIDIPHAFHNSIIGAKGRLIRSVMDECGGVIIRFPSQDSTSDKVIVRGPAPDVENARKMLMELAQSKKESSFTEEVRCKPEYHKFLIGRGGANIRTVREKTGARVVFPGRGDQDQESIMIMGKEDEVKQAKALLEESIQNLDKIEEAVINVDPKYHRHFVQRRGEVLRQISDEYGGVTVSFPRSGVKSDAVTIKGAKDCVQGAKKRILEIVDDLEQQVTIVCVIAQKQHRTVMGARGSKVQEITKEFDVGIKFPDKPQERQQEQQQEQQQQQQQQQPGENGEPVMNGDVKENGHSDSEEPSNEPKKCDMIMISGKKENCEGAKEALLNLVPITEEMDVPFDYHRYIIGQKGREIRKMMETYDVNISVPPSNEQSDTIKIQGAPSNVARAKVGMHERIAQLDEEKKDRELKSFAITVEVDPKYHPKIIGRRGAVVTKIRTDFDVDIQFPDKGSEEITITGYEDKVHAAKEEILKIVKDLEEMITEECKIDHRVFPRLIGPRGRAIRKIMDDYKVDIKFPANDAEDPDKIEVTGLEDNVLDCIDNLLNLEEEYMQDVNERAMLEQYQKPSRNDEPERRQKQAPFVVRGAPWEASAPDMSSESDFPELGASKGNAPIRWGPKVKR